MNVSTKNHAPMLRGSSWHQTISAFLKRESSVTSDFNGFQQEGFGRLDMTVGAGRRSSTANAYLRPAMQRHNLTVRTHALATRILFEGGRAIGLRADMDALPMQEENEFAHKSRYDGRMHGCGHDGHTTMLLAAARYLHETRNFDGTAYLIFQPGEEGFAGGKAMVDDGLFERFPADEIYALHNWPSLPPGKIGVRPGPAMAAADRIEIHIEGRGGHGAHPHLTVDPVLVAGHIITAVQSIVARNVSPIDTAVISLCAMHAGNLAAMSVIPASQTARWTSCGFTRRRCAARRRRRPARARRSPSAEFHRGLRTRVGTSGDTSALRCARRRQWRDRVPPVPAPRDSTPAGRRSRG